MSREPLSPMEGADGASALRRLPRVTGSGSAKCSGREPGFPSIPPRRSSSLKARLSDAFDRFPEGVADNRQVRVRRRRVAAEGGRGRATPPRRNQTASPSFTAELDARRRSIPLAYVIDVENDLGFGVHFQQPGESSSPARSGSTPGCARCCSPRSLPTAATSGSPPWWPPTSPTGGSSTSMTDVSSRRTSARRAPPSSTASPASTPPATGGDGSLPTTPLHRPPCSGSTASGRR